MLRASYLVSLILTSSALWSTSCCRKPEPQPPRPPIMTTTAPMPIVCDLSPLPVGPRLGAAKLPQGRWFQALDVALGGGTQTLTFDGENDFLVDRRALVALGQWAVEVGEFARQAMACKDALVEQRGSKEDSP